jgi:hypothetical protein
MPKLKVNYEVPGTDVTQIFLDDVEFPIIDGKAETTVNSGKHVLRWRAKGARADTEYTIKITAPTEAIWEPDPRKIATSEGEVRARHTFTIK